MSAFIAPKLTWSRRTAGNSGRTGPTPAISVHPSDYRTANTIYCAFPRMFGAVQNRARHPMTRPGKSNWTKLDARGYTVIPPSGKLRDLIGELPHIFDTLGCRIMQLLPGQSDADHLRALRPVWQSLCLPGLDSD